MCSQQPPDSFLPFNLDTRSTETWSNFRVLVVAVVVLAAVSALGLALVVVGGDDVLVDAGGPRAVAVHDDSV